MPLSPCLCPPCATRFLCGIPLVLSLENKCRWRDDGDQGPVNSCPIPPSTRTGAQSCDASGCSLRAARWLFSLHQLPLFLVKLRHLLLPQVFPTLSEGS